MNAKPAPPDYGDVLDANQHHQVTTTLTKPTQSASVSKSPDSQLPLAEC